MIYCGVDIIEISRIKESIDKFEKTFLDKIFTQNEIKYCEKFKSNRYEHYAVRFAAKEAIYKAFSKIIDLNWKDVEILNQESGRPYVGLVYDNFEERLSSADIEILKNAKIDITLSHNNSQAIAYVVAEV